MKFFRKSKASAIQIIKPEYADAFLSPCAMQQADFVQLYYLFKMFLYVESKTGSNILSIVPVTMPITIPDTINTGK